MQRIRLMDPRLEHQRLVTRRQLFGRTALGFGTAALASLLGKDLLGSDVTATAPRGAFPTFAPKAKRVIYLIQSGAPSHVDLFDYKPNMAALRGQDLPA